MLETYHNLSSIKKKEPNLRPKILLVDDSEVNLLLLEKLLSPLDVEFIRANSGTEALKKALEEEFAIALIDIEMPHINGFETVKRMRYYKKTKFLPIIFISAIYSDDYFKIKGIQTGAVDFISKPIVIDILLGKLKIFIELYHQKKKLEQQNKELKELTKERKKHIEELKKHRYHLANLVKEKTFDLEKAKNKAERADKLKTAFLSNMSHEIRTPMNSIVGFSELLLNKDLPKQKKQEFITYIKDSTNNLLYLIDDILDIAKIEAEQIKIKINECRLNQLLFKLYAVFHQKNNKKINLILDRANHSSNFTILTDNYRLNQVLTNLINNAYKFTYHGNIKFGYIEKNNNTLLFFVRDTGIGISNDKKKHIFDRFHKIKNIETEKIYSGAGLGLTISKKLIELLGGNIWVESEIGKGSVFYFTLPFEKIESKNIKDMNLDILQTETELKYNWEEKLIVDEELNFLFLEEALKDTNAKIIWVKDGEEVINICEKHHNIDLILMDIQMPKMRGDEASKLIKKSNPDIFIIAQTAFAMDREREEIIKAGCDDYISKPIKTQELLKKISSLFNKKLN